VPRSDHLDVPIICLSASGGGHFRQLLDLEPLWSRYPHFLVTEDTVLARSLAKREDVAFVPHFALGQSRMGKGWAMLSAATRSAWQSLRVILQRRPDVVITTGAGSQVFVIFWARIFGAKVVLVDSFARFHAPSKFARFAGPLAHVRITQSIAAAGNWPGSLAFDPLRIEPSEPIGKSKLLFATVGAILPLHRLERAIVELKRAGRIPEDVILQVGRSELERPQIEGLTIVESIPFDEIQELLKRADLVVCHAGTGSIITALAQSCGVVALPRRVDKGDSYDDHQSEIAEVFVQRGLIQVAEDAETLAAALEQARSAPRHKAAMDHTMLMQHLELLMSEWFADRAAPSPEPAASAGQIKA
jgi:UDP-N-acetylglucosamine--N-acetylmuramyl-(pentapeptide) pyrophosphoryl-undecaprenol N-acetylglucosamine transferase